MSWVPLPWCASQSTTSTRSPRLRERRGRDRDVVQQAEAHRARRDRVMTRRPHRAERGVAVAALERVDRLEPAARGEQRGFPRRRPTRRCRRRGGRRPRAQNCSRWSRYSAVCTRSSSARVARRGSRRRRASAGRTRVEPVEDGPHPRRALGMAAPGVVLFEAGVGRDQEHAARLTNRHDGRPRPASRRYARRR